MARALAERGCVVATPEYRRVGGGGGWPVTGDDVLLAVRRLPELLGGSGHRHRPDRARRTLRRWTPRLWLAARSSPVDRVVALAPVCDLREAIRLGLGDDATQALLGDQDPSAPTRWCCSTTARLAVAVVHGVADDVVPLSLSRGLVERHPWVDLREVPGGHMG